MMLLTKCLQDLLLVFPAPSHMGDSTTFAFFMPPFPSFLLPTSDQDSGRDRNALLSSCTHVWGEDIQVHLAVKSCPHAFCSAEQAEKEIKGDDSCRCAQAAQG